VGPDTAAAPEAVRVAGIVLAALLAAAGILAPGAAARARAMLAALALTPVLLVVEIWGTPQLAPVRADPLPYLGGAALVALLVCAPLARLFARRPGWLALAALAALPFRVPVEAGGATANLLVPLYVVIAAGVLAWAVPRLREAAGRPRPNGPVEWLLAAAVVLYAVQAAYSSAIDRALEQTVFFYVPFALLFVILRDVEWSRRRLRLGGLILVGLALAFAAIGFVEYATRTVLFNPKVIASNQFESYFRVNSLFFDPNIYGRFLAVVMIGLAAVLLWERRSREVWSAALALAVLWGGLVLTLSQSSFAALLAGLLVLAALRFPLRKVAPVALAVAAAGVVLVLAFPSALRLDLDSAASLDDATSGRYELVTGGLELAERRPLLGWGSGAFRREYRRQASASDRAAVSASHTIPLTVAAEQGVAGLAVYAALLVAAFARLLRGASRDPWRALVAAGFTAVIVHTLLYAAFLEDPMTWTLLAVGTALAWPRQGLAGRAGAAAAAAPGGNGVVSGSSAARAPAAQ